MSYEAPLDAPPSSPDPSLPSAFWWQLLALPILMTMTHFLYLHPYYACIVIMSSLLLLELKFTATPANSTLSTFRPLALWGAILILVGVSLFFWGGMSWMRFIASLGTCMVCFYFLFGGALIKEGEKKTPLTRIIFGIILFFFYFCLFTFGFKQGHFSIYLFIAVIPALLLCCYLFFKYWKGTAQEKTQVIQHLNIVRTPQLLHLLLSVFSTYYYYNY